MHTHCGQLLDKIKQVHDFMTVAAPSPLMEACLVGLNQPLSYYEELGALYEHMKSVFVGGLKDLGFTYTDPQGAYYVMVNVGEFSKGDDVAACAQLLNDRLGEAIRQYPEQYLWVHRRWR